MITLELKDSIELLLSKHQLHLVKFIGYEPTGHFLLVCYNTNEHQRYAPMKHSDDEEDFVTSSSTTGSIIPQSIVHVDFLAQKVNTLCKLSSNLDCFGGSLNFNHSVLAITTCRVLYKTSNNGASLVVTNNPNENIAPQHSSNPNIPSVNSYENNNLKLNETFMVVSNLKSFLTKKLDDSNSSNVLSPNAPSISSSNPALMPPSNEKIMLYETYFIELKTKNKQKSQTLFQKSNTPTIIQFIHSNRLKNGKNYFLLITNLSIQIFSFPSDIKTGAIKGAPKEVKTITSKTSPDGESATSSFTSLFSSKPSQPTEENEMIWYQWDVDTHLLYFIIKTTPLLPISTGKPNLSLYCWKIDLDELQMLYKCPILNHLPPDLIHFGSKDFPASEILEPIQPYFDKGSRTSTLAPNSFNTHFMECSSIRMQIVKLEGTDILCMQYKDLRPSLQENLLSVFIYHFRGKKCLKLNLQSKQYLFIGKYKKNNLILLLPSKYLQLIKGSTLSTIFQFNKTQFDLTLHNDIPDKLDEPHTLLPVFAHIEGHFINLRNGCIFNFDLMITYLTSSHWLQIPDLVNDQFIPVLEFILGYYNKDTALQFLSYLFYSMEKSPHKKDIHFTKLISLGMKEYIIGACFQQASLKGMEPEFLSLLPSNRHGFYESILGLVSSVIKKKQLKIKSNLPMDSPRSGGSPNQSSNNFSPTGPQQALFFGNENYEEYVRLAVTHLGKNKNWNAKKWASEFSNIVTEEMELLFETIMSQKNEEEVYYFKLMECFYTSLLLDFRLPSPSDFNFNFVFSGFKALEREIFYQYCDRGVFEITNQIINALCQSDLLGKENEEDIYCLNYLLRISTDSSSTSFLLSHLEGIEQCQLIIAQYLHSVYSMNTDFLDPEFNQNSLKKILKKKQKKIILQEKQEREYHTYIRENILNIIGKQGSFGSSTFAAAINGSQPSNIDYGSFIEEARRNSEPQNGGENDSEENSECSDASRESMLSALGQQTSFAPLVSYLLSIQKLSQSLERSASLPPMPSLENSPSNSRMTSTFSSRPEEDDGLLLSEVSTNSVTSPLFGLNRERDYIQSVASDQYLRKYFW